jgi:hypothetical protein
MERASKRPENLMFFMLTSDDLPRLLTAGI